MRPDAVVLQHGQNLGKGRAIKTGLRYCAEQGMDAAVTADADGQHAPEDILAICRAMEDTPDALILGSRAVEQMPPKSRWGNSMTRALFRALYGVNVTDTQTGLRGIPLGRYTEPLLALAGDRYEYEMNMLIRAGQMGLAIREYPIRTIYYDQNSGSHFRPLRDGIKIYRVIFGNIPGFIAASFGSFLIDYALFNLLYLFSRNVVLSTVLARVVSASCNYTFNKRLVFKNSGKSYNVKRYFGLAVSVLAVNCTLMYLFAQLQILPIWAAKIVVELTLYIVSYVFQNRWAYRG